MSKKKADQLRIPPKQDGDSKKPECGVFDYYSVVYRDEDQDAYAAELAPYLKPGKKPADVYRLWRTYQMSDHLPMWIRLRTDHSEQYLGDYRPKLAAGREREEDP